MLILKRRSSANAPSQRREQLHQLQFHGTDTFEARGPLASLPRAMLGEKQQRCQPPRSLVLSPDATAVGAGHSGGGPRCQTVLGRLVAAVIRGGGWGGVRVAGACGVWAEAMYVWRWWQPSWPTPVMDGSGDCGSGARPNPSSSFWPAARGGDSEGPLVQIRPSHMAESARRTRLTKLSLRGGVRWGPTNPDGYFNRVRYGPFADGACSELCANLMASADGSSF
jgi:hypothetical protein